MMLTPTMETVVPHVYCVAVMMGGFGGEGVRRFYTEHFINQIPKDAKVTPVSRTVGKDQVVDEFILSFTHDTQWHYMLPGIPPTGKRVELPKTLNLSPLPQHWEAYPTSFGGDTIT